jgi:hypothetical protein
MEPPPGRRPQTRPQVNAINIEIILASTSELQPASLFTLTPQTARRVLSSLPPVMASAKFTQDLALIAEAVGT